MDIFSIITLLGGLAFFLFGMDVMSGGLERVAGGKLEGALRKLTSNRIKSLFLGLGVTAVIQSSSAVTVMLVGLVNSGIMNIGQTVGVIMGSNVGTTVTAWLLSTIGIDSDIFVLRLLKPENFSLVFALVGILLTTVSKKDKQKDMGSILIGFAVLMYGMKMMSGAVEPLTEMPEFQNILTLFTNPIIGILVGAAFTGVIQSSSASVGVLQALALSGNIPYSAAIPIIMGQNIGTCVTALLSSIGVSRNAKKVSIIHISFNLIGTVSFSVLFYATDALFDFAFTETAITPWAIAVVHSIFNIATTLLLLPFANLLVMLANRLLPDKEEGEKKRRRIDARLLETPALAIAECESLTAKMAELAKNTLSLALALSDHYNEDRVREIVTNEDILDNYEDELGTVLVQLSSKHLSDADSIKVSRMLHVIGDLERLGDHAVNLLDSTKELHDKKLSFSENAKYELDVLTKAIREILELSVDAICQNNIELAAKVEPLEQVIDSLVDNIKSRHITRLTAGECSIELGFILSDILGNCERISDHCSNLGVTVIELKHRTLDTHRYLNAVKYDDPSFKAMFADFEKKYALN